MTNEKCHFPHEIEVKPPFLLEFKKAPFPLENGKKPLRVYKGRAKNVIFHWK